MTKTIDMQLMRYINLFEKICHVSTTNCFVYNNTIIFAVPRPLILKALGKNNTNIKKISETFRKRVKVIEMIHDLHNLERFISNVVDPISFSKLELKENIVTINANKQNKVSLIGRGKVRQKELEDILKKFFGVEKLKIA
ncbi:MAG: hypothetical protein ACOYT4_04240 [Nanoarchaeota archaeon]